MADDLMYRTRVTSSGWGGAPGLNTFYFAQDDVSQADHYIGAQSCADRVHSAFVTMAAIYPSIWTGVVTPVVDILNADNGDLVESVVVVPPAPVIGGTTASFGPQAAMICASLITPDILDSRHVKGRVFLGPCFPGSDPDGTPQGTMLAFVGSALSTLFAAPLPAPELVVWSRRKPVSGRHPTGLGGSAHTVTGVTVKDSFAILRSRRQ